jgi:hypothetical protein
MFYIISLQVSYFLTVYSSITNNTQRYAMVFITIKALHVSGGSSAHHQELKIVYTVTGIFEIFLLLTATVRELELTRVSSNSSKKQKNVLPLS